MPALLTPIRKDLEEAIKQARRTAEIAAQAALEALAVHEAVPYPHMDETAKRLRRHLCARAQQLGDLQTPDKKIRLERLRHECAYEHWHRMLFARFLAENHFLVEPESKVAISLEECKELAAEEKTDLWAYASRLAQRMLPLIFRPNDPLLQVTFAREHRVKLEGILAGLDPAVFTADDALGWVYQFWRAEEKDEVNRGGDKITADTLPAVTQLFTEHYMVEFLLHNTLGAWWTAKNEAAKRTSAIPLPYLRRKEDGSAAAGAFRGWPKAVRELRALDPCCGSGHILVALLQLLVAMRREEEGLGLEEAVCAVLTENLHGLEIDARCSQLAAFNVAFAAWKLIGRPVELPVLHIACSGLSVGGTREEWVQAVESSGSELRFFLGQLYELFKKAPDLGSLINPARLIGGSMHADKLEPLLRILDTALAREDAVKRALAPEVYERGVTAQGLARAAQLLAGRYHLTVTNVPYLGRGNQGDVLKEFIETHYAAGKADLATAFVLRCLEFCTKGGTIALVTPHNWLFLKSYTRLREQLLTNGEWDFVARLGPGAFETITGEVVNVCLVILTRERASETHEIAALDVSAEENIFEKASGLRVCAATMVSQASQLRNPDAVVSGETTDHAKLLGKWADCFQGLSSTDAERFILAFWEVGSPSDRWRPLQSPPERAGDFLGREFLVDWSALSAGVPGAALRGKNAWGKYGVAMGQVSSLPATIFTGELFANSAPVIVPHHAESLLPIWAFCRSEDFHDALRQINPKLSVDNGYVSKVPFDLAYWQEVASEKYPNGLPKPHSDGPTQWLFSGHPRGATEPLQVAVARLLGYQWPRQTGSEFLDCGALGSDGLEEFADEDGIVCLSAIHGEAPAVDELQRLLATAYGSEWSPTRLESLLVGVGYGHKSLKDWLREKYFEQHCALFHQRPFIWHIWDGQPRGFSALVNYHRLAAPNGAGRKLLEKLTYTYLGDWISRQQDAKRNGVAGADDRLAAALELKKRFENILAGEPPFDLFARWKPLHLQPIGWEPDVNDGVRTNLRPFLASDLPGAKKGAGILRNRPGVSWDKPDRGNEPNRPAADYPWFWADGKFAGKRVNDVNLTRAQKEAARAAKTQRS